MYLNKTISKGKEEELIGYMESTKTNVPKKMKTKKRKSFNYERKWHNHKHSNKFVYIYTEETMEDEILSNLVTAFKFSFF